MGYTEIEGAVIARLKSAVRELKAVDTYSGQLEAEIEKLALRLPTAFVVHGGSRFTWVDGATYRESMDISVLVVTRAGSGRAVLERTIEALSGFAPAEGAERLSPARHSLISTNRLVSAHAIEFSTGIDRAFEAKE